MRNILDHEPSDLKGAGFRRGFVHGAQAVTDAVKGHLTQAQACRLRTWIEKIRKWQGSGDEFQPPSPPEL
jgi:hypothetical protein